MVSGEGSKRERGGLYTEGLTRMCLCRYVPCAYLYVYSRAGSRATRSRRWKPSKALPMWGTSMTAAHGLSAVTPLYITVLCVSAVTINQQGADSQVVPRAL